MELILGAGVSLIIQFLKKELKLSEYQTLASVFALSIVAAFTYSWLLSAGMWQNFAEILTTSGAFYTFVLQRFEK